MASAVLRTFAVVERAAAAVRGLSRLRRPLVAVTRLGDCCSVRLDATIRLALADVAFAAVVRLTEDPSAPPYARLPRLVLFDGAIRDVLRNLESPYTIVFGLL